MNPYNSCSLLFFAEGEGENSYREQGYTVEEQELVMIGTRA